MTSITGVIAGFIIFCGCCSNVYDSTPLNLICTFLPDILVKGADYSIENIIRAKEVIANGGIV
jgi:bifunctional ADP-heptose synthase (sugar kinase/adenylyltransferase)